MTQRDCGLELYEAEQLLELLFFVFEHGDDAQDWHNMRRPIGSGIYAVETILARVRKTMEEGKAPHGA